MLNQACNSRSTCCLLKAKEEKVMKVFPVFASVSAGRLVFVTAFITVFQFEASSAQYKIPECSYVKLL